jgi:hypothetical protein
VVERGTVMKQFLTKYKTIDTNGVVSFIDEHYNSDTGRFEYYLAEIAGTHGAHVIYGKKFLLDTGHSRLIYNTYPNLEKV